MEKTLSNELCCVLGWNSVHGKEYVIWERTLKEQLKRRVLEVYTGWVPCTERERQEETL